MNYIYGISGRIIFILAIVCAIIILASVVVLALPVWVISGKNIIKSKITQDSLIFIAGK